jgi:GTPase
MPSPHETMPLMTYDTTVTAETAVLVGVTLPGIDDSETEESLAELGRLVKTLGYDVVGTLCQRRGSLSGATILGAGKLEELAGWTGGDGVIKAPKAKVTKAAAKLALAEAELEDDDCDEDEDEDEAEDHEEQVRADIVVFDCELTPSQISNLQRATGADVFDRTGIIVEIFSRHAKSRAAKLQVEMARLRYLAPRVRHTGRGPADRLGMGGEKTLELDKRKIRDRIAELGREISNIEKGQETGRSARSEHPTVALVGYTNAGKSSMMRALTGSSVLVEDKLFATLDTTVRTLHPPSIPRILVSDTVGFIKKLPTDLVASFHSTLEEARNAGHLLYVVDASDPSFRSQLETTREVLSTIEAGHIPSHIVLNKVDKLQPEDLKVLHEEFPEGLFVSTKSQKDMAVLRDLIIGFFEEDMIDDEVFVPYTSGTGVGLVRTKMRVLGERHDELGTHFQVRARAETLAKLRQQLKSVSRPF